MALIDWSGEGVGGGALREEDREWEIQKQILYGLYWTQTHCNGYN